MFDVVFVSAIWQRSMMVWRVLPCSQPCRNSRAFTLVELLVTIAIIGVVASMLLPALAKGKTKAQTAVCAANMKNWAYATQLYVEDFEDRLPPFGDLSTDYDKPFWHAKLASYVARGPQANSFFKDTAIFRDDLRRCPGGRPGKAPYFGDTNIVKWNSWIGAHFGAGARPLSGPFYYADKGPPLPASRIHKPCDAMIFTDTVSHYVYSPVEEQYRFVIDVDHDGAPDTMATLDQPAYNSARPTIHNYGANVTLLDGHVERVPFKTLWKVDASARVTHSFWYLED